MHRIAGSIRSHLRPGVFLPLLALALAATWYGLGPSLERFSELTGGGRFVDMQPALTAESLVAQARAYSPAAVRYYLGWSAFDYAWPLLSFTAMLFIAAWLFRFLPEARQGAFAWLVAAAYATVLMDWGENALFVAVVLAGTDDPALRADLAVLLHRGKLLGNFAFNAGFLALLVAAIARRARRPAS